MRTHVDWFPLPVQEWRPLNDPPLGRVFYTWMTYVIIGRDRHCLTTYRYFAFDHKFSDFAIRISEGGIVPRLIKKKKEMKKQQMAKKGKDQATPVADEISEDEEAQSTQNQEEVDNEMIEVRKNDFCLVFH